MSSENDLWHKSLAFMRNVGRASPLYLGLTLAAMLLSSCLEGISLFLLIPILAALGVGEQAEASSSIAQAIDGLLAAVSVDRSVMSVLGLFLAVIVTRSLVRFAQSAFTARFMRRLLHLTRMAAYEAISHARWQHIVQYRASGFVHAITTQAEQIADSADYVLRLATSVVFIGVGIAVSVVVSPYLTGWILALGVFLAIPMLWFDLRAYRLGEHSWNAMSRIFAQLGNHFSGLKAAKILSAETQFENDFRAISEEYSNLSARLSINEAQAALFHEVTAAVVLVGFVYVVIMTSGTAAVEPLVLIVIFSRLLPRVFAAQSYFRSLLAILPDYEAFNRLLSETGAARENRSTASSPIRLTRRIRLECVSFAYSTESEIRPLNGVSIELPAHKAIGLVGPSGAGKTTFADLVAGLFPPNEGCVLVDDLVLDEKNRAHWRQSISYVLQDEYLFNDTIAANLRVGSPNATDEELWQALAKARASELVKSLPAELMTPIGDRGIRLSRGQRQRLCLARGLMKKPQLLILDEATSALSPIDEQELIETLKSLSGQITILMIAHRPSSVAWTDRIIALNEGSIIEAGTLSELMAHEGGFTHAMLMADTSWMKTLKPSVRQETGV